MSVGLHLFRAAALAALLLGSCGQVESAPPRGRIDLARGFRPNLRGEHAQPWFTQHANAPRFLPSLEDQAAVLVEYAVSQADWEELGAGLWRAPRPLPGIGRIAARSVPAAELLLGGQVVPPLPGREWGFALSKIRPGEVPAQLAAVLSEAIEVHASFVHGKHVFLFMADGARPPACTLRDPVVLGEVENGAWFVSVGSIRAHGLPVLAGSAETLRCAIPPDSRLSFVAVCMGTAARAGQEAQRARFSVRLNGELILERELTIGPEPRPAALTVALPALGSAEAALSFAVEGPPCLGAFLLPAILPAQLEQEAQGPRDPRPDIVVFLADTYRADNLALAGGDARVAPHVNRLATESLAFTNARAPTSWTFPSHAAMFSGLYPHQSGATTREDTLAAQATTIAERLAEEGYRTVAVTEGGYVSPAFGLAQGFEWFEAVPRKLELTIERALAQVELDDGRPLFLFVQSYRAHDPYLVGEGVRARLGIDFTPADSAALNPQIAGAEASAEQRADQLLLYRGAAAELDLCFGELRAALERRGSWESTFVVFTSDHGEAFYEHGVHGHGNGVWEEHVRVPLLVRGPGITAGRQDLPAGLIDLPRTLAGIAGVPAHPSWMGTNLLTLDHERPAFLFQCSQQGLPDRMALVAQGRKVLLHAVPESLEEGLVDFAYDLRADPAEQTDLTLEPWPRKLLAGHGTEFQALLRALLVPAEAELSAELEEALRALGYLGD